jgi:hypothetical protein
MVNLNYSRAGDIDPGNLTYGIMLVGKNGSGKSWAGASAPKPVILFSEKNGIQSARHSNPDAIVVDLHEQFDDDGNKIPAIDVVREIMRCAINGKLHEAFGQPVESIVLDSLTDIQRLFKAEIAGAGGHMSQQNWGTLSDKFRLFLGTLRDCPYNYICLALVGTELEESTGIRHVAPMFQGASTRNEIGQWFNLVAHMFKRKTTNDDGEEVTTHWGMVDGPPHYTTKSQHPLRGTLDPNLSEWIRILSESPEAAKAASN